MRSLLPLALTLLLGCPHEAEPEAALIVEPRLLGGEVMVLPVAGTWEQPQVRLDSYVGAPVPWSRERVRRARTAELNLVPAEVAWSLPGAVNGKLGEAQESRFRPARYPPGDRGRVEAALRGERDLDLVLRGVARSLGGQGALFTWVTDLQGEPISLEGFPGDIVETSSGPVMIDHHQEPYLIKAAVGMALVARDGEVVLRYDDTFEAVLSEHNDPGRVGRDLADALASEVTKVWPVDPRFALGEPRSRRR